MLGFVAVQSMLEQLHSAVAQSKQPQKIQQQQKVLLHLIRLHWQILHFLFLISYLGFLFLAALGLCCCVWCFSSCGPHASPCGGFSCWGPRALGTWAPQSGLPGSRAQAQQLRCTGLVALQQVESSQTRDRTRVPCIGRRILNHQTTREVLYF